MNLLQPTAKSYISDSETFHESANQDADSNEHLAPGVVLEEHYEILQHIGKGGMADVYLANQLRLDRVVAVKVLLPELSSDKSVVQKFIEEADTLSRISHPNITNVLDRGCDNGVYYLVLEFVEGCTIDDLILTDKLHSDQWVDIIRACSDSISYIHDIGLVHLDIKPSNIMIDKKNRIKLADFGIARHVSGKKHQSKKGSYSGTLKYMSPEQTESDSAIDHRSDVFSLAVTFYKIFTGNFPTEDGTPASKLNSSLTKRIDEILIKGMAPDRDNRYQTAKDLCDALIAELVVQTIEPTVTTGSQTSSVMLPKLSSLTGLPERNPTSSTVNTSKNTTPKSNFKLIAAIAFGLVAIITAVIVVPSLSNSGTSAEAVVSNGASAVNVSNGNDSMVALDRSNGWKYASVTLPNGTYEYDFAYDSTHSIYDKNNPDVKLVGNKKRSVIHVPGGATGPFGNRVEWPKVNDETGEVVFRFQNENDQDTFLRGSFNEWSIVDQYKLK